MDVPPARRLLEESPYDVARPFPHRERATERVLAAGLLAVAVALAASVPAPVPAALAGGLVVAYALAARVRFHVGAGMTVPTQVFFIPMLFLLPPGAVPLLVAAALVLSSLPDVARGKGAIERLTAAVGDAWYAVGPALALGWVGDGTVVALGWGTLTLALAVQLASDAAASVAREWAGRGIAPAMQLRVLASVHVSDALLTPVGALAVLAAATRPGLVFAALALVGLLALISHDRAVGVRRAAELTRQNQAAAVALQSRVDELSRERGRLQAAIERVGRTFSSSLDREELLEIALQTAVDAVDADCGRIRLRAGPEPEQGPCEPLAPALADAERVVGTSATGSGFAVARALGEAGLIAVARHERAFTPDECHVLDFLAANTAASLANVTLHELAARQAMTDELTGLSNHRRFYDVLEERRGAAAELALIILDLDDFKRINDRHGHQVGDAVLRAVGGVVRANCRETDEAARYGGEEIAVLMPDTPLDVAHATGERIRRAIAAEALPLPGGGALRVTASVGVAAIPAGGSRADLVAAADAALYEAKRGGKNRTLAQRHAGGRPSPGQRVV